LGKPEPATLPAESKTINTSMQYYILRCLSKMNKEENEFENEMEGVELALASQKFRMCKHILQSEEKETYTQDGRKKRIRITTCKNNCGYYKVETLFEEPVSDEAIWR
jgi:hypothetical protein